MLVQKKRNRGLRLKFRSVEGFVVSERFTVETAMVELPKVCHAELFGWECARERKIISALVDIPEFCPAQFDEEYLQTNY